MNALTEINIVGLHWLDGLETNPFNPPEAYRYGSQTFGYSWRLIKKIAFNHDYESDIVGLPKTSLVSVGRDDVAMDAERFSNGFNDLHDNVELIGNQDRFCRCACACT